MSIRRESKSENNLATKQTFKFQCFNGLATRMKSGKANNRDENKSRIDSWRENLTNCCYRRKREENVIIEPPKEPPKKTPEETPEATPSDDDGSTDTDTKTENPREDLDKLIDELYEAKQKNKAIELSLKVKISIFEFFVH